jgi:hypothetical protein
VIDRWLLRFGAVLAVGGTVAVAAVPGAPAPAGPAPSPAQISFSVLPQGENRDLVIRACAVCHPPELVVARHRTADEWDVLIARMVNLGALADDNEQQKIFEYLVKYFSADAPALADP